MSRFGISSWSAFERTIFADILALALLVLVLAVLWTVGAVS
jgi:hypothetical protein